MPIVRHAVPAQLPRGFPPLRRDEPTRHCKRPVHERLITQILAGQYEWLQ